MEKLKAIARLTPYKTILLLMLGWLAMLFLNYYLNSHGYFTGSRITFPISVVYFSTFSVQGIVFALVFLLFAGFCWFNYSHLSKWGIVVSYALLILLGNLAQGSLHQTFTRAFLDTDFQYYHDAIGITNASDFLHSFNKVQDTLSMHSKTHPPFAVLLHYVFLKIFNQSPLYLSFAFSIISLCAVFPLIKILKLLNINHENSRLYILLFACIPAVNIYSVVSIDGVFLTFSLFFLYELLSIIASQKLSFSHLIALNLGLILANSISFSGTFFWALFFFVGVYYFLKYKQRVVLSAFVISVVIFAIIIGLFYVTVGYNHIEAFFNASKSENPNGFMAIHQPLVYFFTRIEDISEILLFSSFAFFALLITPNFWKKVINQKYAPLLISAIFTLFLMFITGAYGTGETAHAPASIFTLS